MNQPQSKTPTSMPILSERQAWWNGLLCLGAQSHTSTVVVTLCCKPPPARGQRTGTQRSSMSPLVTAEHSSATPLNLLPLRCQPGWPTWPASERTSTGKHPLGLEESTAGDTVLCPHHAVAETAFERQRELTLEKKSQEKRSVLLNTEMQIKNAGRRSPHSAQKATVRNLTNTNWWRRHGGEGIFLPHAGNRHW